MRRRYESAAKLRLVLFFTRGISLRVWDQVGSFEREVALYRQLQAHGVQVTFVTYGNAEELQYADRIPGITILCNRWRLPGRIYQKILPFLYGAWFKACDVIKTNQTSGAEIALKVCRLWDKPLVARCGYMWSDFVARQQGKTSSELRRIQQIESEVFQAANKVIVTTPQMAAAIAKRVPQAALSTRVIPNYVDINRFCPLNEVERDIDLIFVGRLSTQKNIGAFLEAIQSLNIRTLVIGNGELSEIVQKYVTKMHGLLMWHRKVPNEELPTYLNRAHLFILPSLYEGHPKALIEAMACGLPVIGADSPGIREVIQHGKTGWLCGTDIDSIRQTIQELLTRSQLRTKLGENARIFAVEHFALERVAKMELELLNSLLA